MTQLESAVWKLFKAYFVDSNFVDKTTYVTLTGMRLILKGLMKRIDEVIASFEAD